jgi:hypothetical protein
MTVCPWCGTVYQEYRLNCMNCGSVLPHRDSLSAGDPPPPPPRQLPKEFVRRARRASQFELLFGSIFGGIGTVLGVIFTVVGISAGLWVFVLVGPLLVIVFGGIGFGVLYWGRRRSHQLINTLTVGLAAEGVINDIYIDDTIQMNGRSPWKVHYTFTVGNLQVAGSQQAWNRDVTLQPDTKVFVVYEPQDPGSNSIYPPLA